jgi:hypothetical protein
MTQRKLTIEMAEGNWMVDIFSKGDDSGVYDLISPTSHAFVELRSDDIHGFRYSLTGPKGTPFKITLDDTVLAEGSIDDTESQSGSGVI